MTTEINKATDPTVLNNASASQNAALRGATLAFGKSAVKPKPKIKSTNTYRGSSQALAAATKVGSKSSSASRNLSATLIDCDGEDRMVPQYSEWGSLYGPTRGSQEFCLRPSLLAKTDSLDYLQPRKSSLSRPVSPSHIAATLAVSRSTSISPSRAVRRPASALATMQTQAGNSGSRLPSLRHLSPSRNVSENTLNTTPVPQATSLVGIFERAVGTIDLAKGPIMPSTPAMESATPEIQSPRPLRPQPSIVKRNPVQLEKPNSSTSNKEKFVPELPSTPSIPATLRANEIGEDNSSNDSFSVSDQISSSDQKPVQNLVYKQRTPSTSNKSFNSITVDSFADAIASSRPASSLVKVIPPPPTPSRHGNPSLFHHSHSDARTSSPAKGFRQTMRKPPKDDADEDPGMQKRGRKNIIKKHPNKHNEGDRKRWRDSVTERERKRYEAVWASNKGLFVARNTLALFPPPPNPDTGASVPPPGNPADLVSNIVVRDIWSRSRLGNDVLAEVWELVDRGGLGQLSREEFVAGMWLIDQRLKGRKLPIRISPSVWASVGGLGGVIAISIGRKR